MEAATLALGSASIAANLIVLYIAFRHVALRTRLSQVRLGEGKITPEFNGLLPDQFCPYADENRAELDLRPAACRGIVVFESEAVRSILIDLANKIDD